jgi:hydroxymethylbilane synthase
MLGADVEVVAIKTSGDAGRGADKARFVKEIEESLLAGEVDLAVHSAKDVPAELPEGLAIVGVPPRADARDALCGGSSLGDLPEGAVIGTSSLRRRSQLLAVRPELDVRDARGNVDTRLGRLADGGFDALVLAAAGLERLGRDEGVPIPARAMTPAAGQGCLALEARSDDARARELGARITHRQSLQALTAERALVSELGATCNTPVGAHARVGEGAARLEAFAGLPDGSTWVRDSLEGDAARPAELGREVAKRMVAAGAGDLLADAERAAI